MEEEEKIKFYLRKLKKNFQKKLKLKLIDDYGVNGDFIESQAFAFLAIRSFKKLPISFPNTTNCKTLYRWRNNRKLN